MTPKAARRGWLDSLIDRLLGWRASFPPEQNNYTTQTITLPLEGDDNVQLAADLYQPLAVDNNLGAGATAVGTLLIQSPYGRSAPLSIFLARLWAARGYNVLFVSTRGTFGSGSSDQFDPAALDQKDAIRVVRWMRRQSWYTGSFATFVRSPFIYLTYPSRLVVATYVRVEFPQSSPTGRDTLTEMPGLPNLAQSRQITLQY